MREKQPPIERMKAGFGQIVGPVAIRGYIQAIESVIPESGN
jgi:hypothetical protein